MKHSGRSWIAGVLFTASAFVPMFYLVPVSIPRVLLACGCGVLGFWVASVPKNAFDRGLKSGIAFLSAGLIVLGWWGEYKPSTIAILAVGTIVTYFSATRRK